jgi:hypothetical protein
MNRPELARLAIRKTYNVDSALCIISSTLVHADSNGDSHALPFVRLTIAVTAQESAYYRGVVSVRTLDVLVEIVKSEMKAFNFE